ncbi:hypothetical protein [Parafrankia elaeagni]|uniref:hypothetical protein n=1 Tax=Parafrankia elaeagni TaxID=222534 RepID=UPI00037F2BCE|nr:hypothetical protein [Parafrankia elaeagni]
MSDPQGEPRSVVRRLAGGAAILLGAVALLTGRVSCGVGVDNGTVVDLDDNRFRPPTPVTGPSLSPDPDGLVAPQTAGGLRRDQATEAAVADLAARAQDQLPANAVDTESIVHAVYRAVWGEVLFFGGAVTDADSLLTAFRTGAARNGATVTDIDPGTGGGRAACSSHASDPDVAIPTCIWVTADAFGQTFPLIPRDAAAPSVPTLADLADLTRRMRPDLAAFVHPQPTAAPRPTS